MKRILYLTFYFEPDLSACSFRNTPLVKELAAQAAGKARVEVLTTMPNRYDSSITRATSEPTEEGENYSIHRFNVPENKGGMKSQILAYQFYFRAVRKFIKSREYDMVVASTAKLFTGYLASGIAKKQGIPLYLDVRDLFLENLENILGRRSLKSGVLPFIKQIEKRTFSRATHINLISEGFKPNFSNYFKANYSYFTNGIDQLFLKNKASLASGEDYPKKIVYAGNIGEGQGLDKIIPEAAKKLGEDYQFTIIGDGGRKPQLADKIDRLNLRNVKLEAPVKRKALIKIYEDSDFTFVHLNDYDAFKKVLPSKIFELACFPQPMIAGVDGQARDFISKHVENKILFSPCDVDGLVSQLQNFTYKRTNRSGFIKNFKRSAINKAMSQSMLEYL